MSGNLLASQEHGMVGYVLGIVWNNLWGHISLNFGISCMGIFLFNIPIWHMNAATAICVMRNRGWPQITVASVVCGSHACAMRLSTNLLQSLPYFFCRYFLLSYVITLRRIRHRIRCSYGCKSNFVSAEQVKDLWMMKRWKRAMSKTSPHGRCLSLFFCFRCPPFVKFGMLYENERRCEFSQHAARLKNISG